jgi:VIT1/CCC1 family predicted Fe2+/Mn2+ transporter
MYNSFMANTTHKLNWLRASVLGANDGIVSVAGLVIGVAGATNSASAILMAGVAGIVAGAIAMAAGEYVSVSSSKDTEKAILEKERLRVKKISGKRIKRISADLQRKRLNRKNRRTGGKRIICKRCFCGTCACGIKYRS